MDYRDIKSRGWFFTGLFVLDLDILTYDKKKEFYWIEDYIWRLERSSRGMIFLIYNKKEVTFARKEKNWGQNGTESVYDVKYILFFEGRSLIKSDAFGLRFEIFLFNLPPVLSRRNLGINPAEAIPLVQSICLAALQRPFQYLLIHKNDKSRDK